MHINTCSIYNIYCKNADFLEKKSEVCSHTSPGSSKLQQHRLRVHSALYEDFQVLGGSSINAISLSFHLLQRFVTFVYSQTGCNYLHSASQQHNDRDWWIKTGVMEIFQACPIKSQIYAFTAGCLQDKRIITFAQMLMYSCR